MKKSEVENRHDRCPGYASMACVSDSCPKASSDEYPDCDIGAPLSCSECIFSSGDCDDCMFQYTEYCYKFEKELFSDFENFLNALLTHKKNHNDSNA